MNNFRQYFPNFVEVDGPPPTFDFETQDELLDNEILKKWSENTNFHRWSMSNTYLMAEINEGNEWYVVGFIKEPNNLTLPSFTGG